MANTIDPNLMYSSTQNAKRKTGSDILGKDDFLKILMVQLQNQDPLNPMQDKDFIAQMATFSSLEHMTNMSKSMETFVDMQQQNQLVTYSQFVGKEITWHKIVEDKNSEDGTKVLQGKGTIKGVRFIENSVKFILDDGTELDPANISQVNTQSKENALIQASYLIGKSVTWLDDDGKEQKSIVKSVSAKDGNTWLVLDNDKKIKADQLTQIEN
ncbi:flagellar hook assembly protein FlgD [Bacillus sporothermodurans]|uniref:flagellar hook assembly protein FlgD n=1 Tax=Heyndrickxia sporothermodurans TaxID=46224 RepID=UPI00192C3C5C|nr:flagellar hook assembly protein FlgD [Heyndrickxia sporothermodurans]MBL5767227.1 flagellar hook assembly protein FlgD [Heyndrickxia sporothermodurans]MBL5770726.1 flagellar hook assembly protein FlgD [Heyndrickxia sporothermodurans]MBL5774458.1 flagellar hook assembly protein FlgD [Heyndrickxia sporothermodurans]MBL5785068.1 flagellar hook assembly protein FlgD [Heyndrickxia sporothermodurans]MBL5788588.1 flagellar hook assembly protein FlgD [Heyndrickxia sporothermodurans]